MSYNQLSTVKKSRVAISLPFSVNANGSILATTDERKVWADRVLSVVGTALDERLMRPGFGTDISASLFKNLEGIEEDIDREITKSFAQYLDSLNFLETVVTLDEATNTLELEIIYTLPDETQDSVVVGSISMSGNTIVNEVIL